MKDFYGHSLYVQSAGVRGTMEVDGFSVAVCAEIGVSLARHRTRSFDEMREWGDDLAGFDLIIALSPASLRMAQEATRFASLEIEYWPILDPTDLGTKRDEKLDAYRQTREQIKARILARFGAPETGEDPE